MPASSFALKLVMIMMTAELAHTAALKEESRRGFLQSRLSGRCIDVEARAEMSNEARLQLHDCDDARKEGTGQIWEFTADGFLKHALSGKCMDVAGIASTESGYALQLYDCDKATSEESQTDQKWTLSAEGFIVNALSKKCVDVQGVAARGQAANLQLYDCDVTAHLADSDQLWRLVAVPDKHEEVEKWSENGWWEGTYTSHYKPTAAPDGVKWTWEQCASKCASEGWAKCQWWTVQLTGDKYCLLHKNAGGAAWTGKPAGKYHEGGKWVNGPGQNTAERPAEREAERDASKAERKAKKEAERDARREEKAEGKAREEAAELPPRRLRGSSSRESVVV